MRRRGAGQWPLPAGRPCIGASASHCYADLISEATLEELADVLARAKFDSYLTVGERQEFLRLLDRIAVMVPIIHTIRACRDARDDKFLELAVNGEASLIITPDSDLLELDPFKGIPIITPASYLGR